MKAVLQCKCGAKFELLDDELSSPELDRAILCPNCKREFPKEVLLPLKKCTSAYKEFKTKLATAASGIVDVNCPFDASIELEKK